MTAQAWNAEGYAKNARFVAELGAPVLSLLAPTSGERILDLGCGDGVLTRRIVEHGAEVVGVDASPELVRAARELGVDARLGDGEALEFDGEFDAVFSNAALHWMKRPDAVLHGVHRALKQGGRFVAEFGGAGCVQTLRNAIEETLASRSIDPSDCMPWYFPSTEEYASRLVSAGFAVKRIELFERKTPLPTGVRGWVDTFGGAYLAKVPDGQRDAVMAEIEARATPQLTGPDGAVIADYVRLRVVAEKGEVVPSRARSPRRWPRASPGRRAR